MWAFFWGYPNKSDLIEILYYIILYFSETDNSTDIDSYNKSQQKPINLSHIAD